jgi:glycosyltransferase involved in cell wall biosynthesis
VAVIVGASGWGGTEVHTLRLMRELQARGRQVVLISLGLDVYSGVLGTLPEPVELVQLGEVESSWSVAAAIREFRLADCGLALAVKGDAANRGWPVEIAARVAFDRYAVIIHTKPVPDPRPAGRYRLAPRLPLLALRWRLRRLGRGLRARLPRAVFGVSGAVSDGLRDDWAYPAGKVVTVHNGADVARFRPSEGVGAEARRALDVPPHAVVFCFVGRLVDTKGCLDALRAFASLGQDPDRPAVLIVAGDGPQRDRLEAEAAALGVAGSVRFVDAPERVYAAAAAMLLPSYHREGLSLALLEGMASGCVPLAYAAPGVSEVVTPECGVVVAVGDLARLSDAVRATYRLGPAERAAMGAAARRRICSAFDEARQIARLVDSMLAL